MAERAETVPEALKFWGNTEPKRPAFVFCIPQTTNRFIMCFGDLYIFSTRFAYILHTRGVQKTDPVVIALPNSPERAIVEGGVQFVGAVSVDGFCEKPLELIHLMKQSKAKSLVLDPDYSYATWNFLINNCIQLYGPEDEATSFCLPNLRSVILITRKPTGGRGDFLYELKNFKTENYDETELIRPWSICAIMPTSGSQGHYKLVAHTHRSVMAYSKIITPKTDFSSRAFLLNNPMGIASGLFSLTIATGIKRVLMDERSGSVEPRHMADYLCSLIWEEKCSIAEVHPFLVPFMAQKFDATEEPKKLYFLRLTGDKITGEIMNAALKIAHVIVVSFLTTELFMSTIKTVMRIEKFNDHCVGKPIQSVAIRIVDDNGRPVYPGEFGCIQIRTPLVFKEYVDSTDVIKVPAFTNDGYFETNDIGFMLDEELYLACKKRDAIELDDGKKLYPPLLECCIEKCPGVASVVVVTIPHKIAKPGKPALCACVITDSEKTTMEMVQQYVETNHVSFKINEAVLPKPDFYLRFTSFQLGHTGKVDRTAITNIAIMRHQ